MAQAGKAILPRDVNGPFGQRLHLTIGGARAQGLIATAFVTGRVNPSDWNRYSLVVLNWYALRASTTMCAQIADIVP